MKKRYSATFKTKVVIELLREEKTLGQLAAETGVCAKQLSRWKNIALAEMPRVFEVEANKTQEKHEKQLHELYAEIGRLTTQLTWLKKKSGLNVEPD